MLDLILCVDDDPITLMLSKMVVFEGFVRQRDHHGTERRRGAELFRRA